MRIASLTLERYGAYEHRRLAFGPGLTLVTGPNEAGKSTLLDALSDLLWGFPKPARHAYAAAPARLGIAATVLVGDAELHLRRTTRGLTDDTSTPVEPVWGAGGTEARRMWQQSFGLAHTELRDGGRQLCTGGGDLAELVFTARSGRDVRVIIAQLTEEAERLYRPHKNSKVEVRTAMNRFEQLDALVGQQMAQAGTVAALREEIERLERTAASTERERARAGVQVGLAAQRVRTFRQAVELATVRGELAVLHGAGVVLDDAQLTRFDAATQARDRAAGELVEHRARRDDQQRKRAELRVDRALLADAEAIRALDQADQARQADGVRAAELRVEATTQLRAAEHGLSDLAEADGRPIAVRLATLHVPADRAADLDRLADRVQVAEQAADRAHQVQVSALRAVRYGAAGADGVDAEAARRVREVRQGIVATGSAVALRRAAIVEHADALVRIREALAAAGCRADAEGDVGPDAPVPDPPPADRMAELRNRLRAAVEELTGAERDRARADERAQRARVELDGLAVDGRLLGPEGLARARADRDNRLDQVLAVAAAGDEPHALAAAAIALERSVHETDHIADQMIAGADRIAELGRCQALLRTAEEEQEAAGRAAARAHRLHTAATTEWVALWSGLVRAPEPDAADGVHRALIDAHRAESDRRHAQSRIVALVTEAEQQRSQLRAALAAAGRDRPAADLDTLLIVAADLEAAADAARDRRTMLAQLREQGRRAGAEADARRHDLDDVGSRWRFALRSAGLPVDTDPAGWSVRRDLIALAHRAHDEALRLDREADDLQRRLDEHDAAVAALVQRHCASGSGTSLAEVTGRVQEAEQASITARYFDDDIIRITDALRATERTAADAEAVLSRLAAELTSSGDGELAVAAKLRSSRGGEFSAGAELTAAEVAALDAAAERGRRRAELAADTVRRTALLRSAGPDLDFDDWVGTIGGHDQAGLDEECAHAESLEAGLREQHAAITEELGGLRRQLRDLEGAEQAATLHAEAQEQLARAAEAAERYVVVHLQREILRRELEVYERRHSSPLLADAGRLLERLTGGRFVALRPGADDSGRSLVVVRADDEELSTEQLSEGTADQLFLALRLAGIGQLQADRADRGLPPVPVALDDVLMTFDDARATAAITVLAELASRWQILLLTHHDHLVGLAAQAGAVAVVSLEPPGPLDVVRHPDLVRAEPTPLAAAHSTPVSRPDGPDLGAVRMWARANGHPVGDRGRIPAEILDAYSRQS
ncbi:MAG: AAA family ATPase [Pseudonocardia sp.]